MSDLPKRVISATKQLILDSNTSNKSLIFFFVIDNIEIILLLKAEYIKYSFSHFYYLNIDISFKI